MKTNFSTAIIMVSWPCKNTGKFIVRGSVPVTCDKVFETESDALSAILSDPWIIANPKQTVQRVDCSKVIR